MVVKKEEKEETDLSDRDLNYQSENGSFIQYSGPQ